MRTGGQPRHSPCVQYPNGIFGKIHGISGNFGVRTPKHPPATNIRPWLALSLARPLFPLLCHAWALRRSPAHTLLSCSHHPPRRAIVSCSVCALLGPALRRHVSRVHAPLLMKIQRQAARSARQCALNATGRPCPEGCPWPQRRATLPRRGTGRHVRSAAEDSQSPKEGRTTRQSTDFGTSRPTLPSGVSSLLAPQLHGAGVTEGGRVWRLELPSQTQTGRKRTIIWLPNGLVWRRCEALGCPVKVSHLDLSRNARARRLGLSASPRVLRLDRAAISACGKFFFDNVSQRVAWALLLLRLLARILTYRYSGIVSFHLSPLRVWMTAAPPMHLRAATTPMIRPSPRTTQRTWCDLLYV